MNADKFDAFVLGFVLGITAMFVIAALAGVR